MRTARTTLEPVIWEPQKLPDRNATTLPALRGWLAVVVLGRDRAQEVLVAIPRDHHAHRNRHDATAFDDQGSGD